MKNTIKKVLTILSVATILVSCHQIRDYDYSRFYVDPTSSGGGRPLNVMSFNWRGESSNDPGETSWESRRAAVAAMLKDRNPVLMGCQECEPNQRMQILSDDPRYLTIGGDLGYPKIEPEEDVIFYMKDSVEVLDHGTFFLTPTPDVYSRLNQSNHYRVCTWGRMKMKADGPPSRCFAPSVVPPSVILATSPPSNSMPDIPLSIPRHRMTTSHPYIHKLTPTHRTPTLSSSFLKASDKSIPTTLTHNGRQEDTPRF